MCRHWWLKKKKKGRSIKIIERDEYRSHSTSLGVHQGYRILKSHGIKIFLKFKINLVVVICWKVANCWTTMFNISDGFCGKVYPGEDFFRGATEGRINEITKYIDHCKHSLLYLLFMWIDQFQMFHTNNCLFDFKLVNNKH